MRVDYPGDLLLHLESFAALRTEIGRGRAGAFDQTARALGVDRSVLRRRMRTLEDWLGAKLFTGRGASLSPSPAGHRLAERAAQLVNQAVLLREHVTEARARITIGCTGTITTELLPRVLRALERRKPPVQLVIRRAGGALCESLLQSGGIDVGVVRSDQPPRGFTHEHLVDDRLWYVSSTKPPPKLTLERMAESPLVLYGESSRTRARVMDRLGPHGATIRVEVEGRAAALEYVRAGIGATFLSLLPGHRVDAKNVHARDVTALFSPSRFWIVARSDRWSDPTIQSLVAELSARRGR